MLKRIIASGVALGLVIGSPALGAHAAVESNCGVLSVATDACQTVVLNGTESTHPDEQAPTTTSGSSEPEIPHSTDPSLKEGECGDSLSCVFIPDYEDVEEEVEDEEETEEDEEIVTIQDVAEFAPTDSTSTMEPDGWVVTGLHANFYSTAAEHVEQGSLLGRAAEVRFTPTTWEWNYGDGERRETATGGASWSSLRQGEFTATSTSHAYDDGGDYTARLTVEYSAAYRFDGGSWIDIPIPLRVAEEPFDLTVGTASTVLVSEACTAKSDAPGC